MKENIKLYAVYLGGRADGCNTELHDVVFTCGNKIEDTYMDLLDKWFGNADRLQPVRSTTPCNSETRNST